jgi:hypothetical protein
VDKRIYESKTKDRERGEERREKKDKDVAYSNELHNLYTLSYIPTIDMNKSGRMR